MAIIQQPTIGEGMVDWGGNGEGFYGKSITKDEEMGQPKEKKCRIPSREYGIIKITFNFALQENPKTERKVPSE